MENLKQRFFEVAGLSFGVELPADSDIWQQMANYEPFKVPEADGPEASRQAIFTLGYKPEIETEGLGKIELPEPESPWETRLDIYRTPEGDFAFDAAPNYRTPIAGHIELKKDFKSGSVDTLTPFVVNNALMLLYAFASADKGVLEMHSSTVVKDGLGYMFLGKSGTGKSTHSSLWLKNIDGAWLLNDDNPVIRIGEDGRARVYGSPWSGKTPCYKNESAPIGAIVSLHQAPKNEITQQSIPEAYGDIFSSCSGLKFISDEVDNLHETIAQVVTTVGCYDLYCLPDAAAARLCHATVAPKAGLSELPFEKPEVMEISNEILLKEVENILGENKTVVLMTKGYSMLPFIRGGRDSVVLEKQNEYKEGDVVLARISDGRYVLHRIKSIDGQNIILKGDGNLQGTETTVKDAICGKATATQDSRGRQRPIKSAKRWNSMPYIVKRYTLGLLRRIYR